MVGVLEIDGAHSAVRSNGVGNGHMLADDVIDAPELRFQDARLEPIWEKVLDGDRLDLDDGVAILETEDFASAGRMADYVKRQWSGDKVYFVLNRHLNPTNICVL